MRVRTKDTLGEVLDRVAALEARDKKLPRLLTVQEFADFLRTTPKAIRTMYARGQLPHPELLPNKRLLWREEVVLEWFERADFQR